MIWTSVSASQPLVCSSSKVLAHQTSKRGEILHAVNRLLERGECRQELRKVTTRPRESSQRDRRAVISKLAFDQWQQRSTTLDRRGVATDDARLQQLARLLENPRIPQAPAPDGDPVGTRRVQKP